MINVIFDPSQIQATHVAVVGGFAFIGMSFTATVVAKTLVSVTKKIFVRSPVKTN